MASETDARTAGPEESRADLLPLLGILAIGAVLGWNQLGLRAYTASEAVLVSAARADWTAWRHADMTRSAPIYSSLLRLWAWLAPAGPAEAWFRSLGVVIGLGTLAATWWVGCRLFDRRVGLCAALLYALAPLRVLEDRTVGAGPLPALLACLLTLLLHAASAGRRAALLGLAGLVALVGVVTHPAFGVVLLAHLAWIAVRWRQHPGLGGRAALALLVGFVGYGHAAVRMPSLFAALFAPAPAVAGGNWVAEAPLRAAYALQALALGETVPLVQAWALALGLAALLLALGRGLPAACAVTGRWGVLVAAAVALPIAGLAVNPINYPAMATLALPFAAVLAAAGVVAGRRTVVRFLLLAAFLTAALVAIANDLEGAPRSFHDAARVEPFREQVQELRRALPPGDRLLVAGDDPGLLRYLSTGALAGILRAQPDAAPTVEGPGQEIPLSEFWEQAVAGARDVWVVARVAAGRMTPEQARAQRAALLESLPAAATVEVVTGGAFGPPAETPEGRLLGFMGFSRPATELLHLRRKKD